MRIQFTDIDRKIIDLKDNRKINKRKNYIPIILTTLLIIYLGISSYNIFKKFKNLNIKDKEIVINHCIYSIKHLSDKYYFDEEWRESVKLENMDRDKTFKYIKFY